MRRDIGVQMLTFGKSRKNVRGLIGRKWFDDLVKVRERVIETAAKTPSITSQYECWIDAFSFTEEKPASAKKTLRENREFNAGKNDLRKFLELRERFWWMDVATTKQMIEDERRNKPKRRNLGDLYLEANLDGKEKLERKEARQNRYDSSQNFKTRKRNARSWKSCGQKQIETWIPTCDLTPNDGKFVPIGGTRFKACKQWATKKPGFHCAWTIGDEMSAGYLQHEAEIEAHNEYIAALIVAEYDREEYESDDFYFNGLVADLDELDERYLNGRWNHDEIRCEIDCWYDDEEDTQLWYQNAIAA